MLAVVQLCVVVFVFSHLSGSMLLVEVGLKHLPRDGRMEGWRLYLEPLLNVRAFHPITMCEPQDPPLGKEPGGGNPAFPAETFHVMYDWTLLQLHRWPPGSQRWLTSTGLAPRWGPGIPQGRVHESLIIIVPQVSSQPHFV